MAVKAILCPVMLQSISPVLGLAGSCPQLCYLGQAAMSNDSVGTAKFGWSSGMLALFTLLYSEKCVNHVS
jgi:hypothetical protein